MLFFHAMSTALVNYPCTNGGHSSSGEATFLADLVSWRIKATHGEWANTISAFEASNRSLLTLAIFLVLTAPIAQTLNKVTNSTNKVEFFIKQLLLNGYLFNNKILFWD